MVRTRLLLATALLMAGCGGSAVSVAELAMGDCFDDPTDATITELELIDCSQPHDNEVYANLQVEETLFPGSEVLEAFAFDACLAPFESYVGEPYADSPLDYWFLTPTEESWNRGGDRAITCVLYAADLSKLTGSARNAG